MRAKRTARPSADPLPGTPAAVANQDGMFRPGELTLLLGPRPEALALLHACCADAACRGRGAVWVDGGNALDPLDLSRRCRALRCGTREALDRVNVARAFTAYQLQAIIGERLEAKVLEASPSLVLVASLDQLFDDPDVDRREARCLLRASLEDLRSLARRTGAAVLASASAEGVPPSEAALAHRVLSAGAHLHGPPGRRGGA